MARYGFKVKVTWPDNEQGREVAKTCSMIAVTKNTNIRTAADAVKHCMMVSGQDQDGQPVRLIHNRDIETGEYVSIIAAEPASEEPFSIDQLPLVQSIADAPSPQVK